MDVRMIAATDKDLSEAVSTGQFREDLYYRLNVFPIQVPALRERPEDIPLFIDYFLDKITKEYGRRLLITPPALGVLTQYAWPGNVREMENLIERLAIMVEGVVIDVDDFPPYLRAPRQGAPEAVEDDANLSRLEELEKREVAAALERNDWVQSRAARELGLTLRQMGYRIKKFRLQRCNTKRSSQSFVNMRGSS